MLLINDQHGRQICTALCCTMWCTDQEPLQHRFACPPIHARLWQHHLRLGYCQGQPGGNLQDANLGCAYHTRRH